MKQLYISHILTLTLINIVAFVLSQHTENCKESKTNTVEKNRVILKNSLDFNHINSTELPEQLKNISCRPVALNEGSARKYDTTLKQIAHFIHTKTDTHSIFNTQF